MLEKIGSVMIEKIKEKSALLGLVFTIASALVGFVLTWVFFLDEIFPLVEPYLFDCGIDVVGDFACAALYFGSMRQEGDGAKTFRTLIVFVSAGFLVNAFMYLSMGLHWSHTVIFALIILGKLIDLVLIFYFYQYVKVTLGFEGKLASWTEKGLPILFGLELLILLSNIFYPTTFYVDANGAYQATDISFVEDIYLIVTSVIATILIVRSESPRNQKTAALTFIFLPLFNYLTTIGEFGNASNYGMVLMSMIIMYCIIFNDKSAKLASTESELSMATEIQASMLPSLFPAFPTREEFDLYASMDPAKEVGGDFYDFFMIDDDHLGLVIADVSGKGVPAALFMMISKTIVHNFATIGLSAAEALNKANETLCTQNKMEMFVTVWLGILEISTGKMNCASAGHEYPAICHDGRFELLKDPHGLVLGAMDISRYKGYDINLGAGDKIFVYTDGVAEATNLNDELFGTDRMIDALNSKPEAKPEETLRTVRAAVDGFVGAAEQFDDLTMLCLEYKGPAGQADEPKEK